MEEAMRNWGIYPDDSVYAYVITKALGHASYDDFLRTADLTYIHRLKQQVPPCICALLVIWHDRKELRTSRPLMSLSMVTKTTYAKHSNRLKAVGVCSIGVCVCAGQNRGEGKHKKPFRVPGEVAHHPGVPRPTHAMVRQGHIPGENRSHIPHQ